MFLVREAIMYSQVMAKKKVVVEGGKGWIVGGKVCAGETIAARIIGSKLGATTELEVGVSIKPRERSATVQLNDQDEHQEDVPFEAATLGNNFLQNLEEAPKNVPLDKSRLVKVKENLYPGVRITINSASCLIRDETAFVILYYSFEGKIVAQSYR